MKALLATALLITLGAGCAAQRQIPLVDIAASPATGTRDFNTDVVECQDYAATIDTGQSAIAGAIAGAVLNAALGAAVGGIIGHGYAGQGAAIGAAGGGIDGLAAGIAAAEGRKTQILNNCLVGRGWNVL